MSTASLRPHAVPHRAVPPRPVRRLSLAVRTALGVVLLLALVLAAFAATALAVSTRTLDTQLEQSVTQAWERSATFLMRRDGPDDGGPAPGRDPLQAPGQAAGMLAVVVQEGEVVQASRLDADGSTVQLSAADLAALTALATASADAGAGEREGGQGSEPQLTAVDLDAGSYLFASGEPGGPQAAGTQTLAVVGLPTAGVDQTKATLWTVLLVGSLCALTAAGLLGWWWIRRSLQPLEEVSRTAAQVAELELGRGEVSLVEHRVPERLARPGDEVGQVGQALNRLIESVDEAFEQRNRSTERLRTFVADASHELRTPLAAVRGYAEMLRLTERLSPTGQDSLGRVLQQSDRMGSLVEDLLLLARLDAGREEERRRVDLGELVVDAVTDATAAGRDHTWTTDLPQEDLVVLGDPRQLGQLVANLLSNARKHTPAGTVVEVRLEAAAGEAVLTVADDGPGIPADRLPTLFDRFVRGDAARTSTGEGSTGLGLSIVRSIARVHGGEVTVGSTVEAGAHGTTFTLILPLAAPSPA